MPYKQYFCNNNKSDPEAELKINNRSNRRQCSRLSKE